ncbi:dihydrofolate reductase family protein [Streptomyces pratensis]|uniref:dihydrofolate reductase family protein n=1 Tax=Streptomyces pratensis TaxID=1169025 RepID=UPI003017884C
MTATYTFDVFSSLDGYGAAGADWSGYWGRQGPELFDHRLALHGAEQRMVFGANTYRAFARMPAESTEESEVPLRSHGSLSLNRALMAAGLVDRVQVTLFPVITGRTGLDPVFRGAADFDLELVESRTLDGHMQELVYRPTLH